MINLTLKQVYARFIQDEFPPKFVFCVTLEGEIRKIYLSEIDSLESKYSYQGMCYNSELPIIDLTVNPTAII